MTNDDLGLGDLTWSFGSTAPSDWADSLRKLKGGFFHTPIWPDYDRREDSTVFVEARVDGAPVALAVGASRRCRIALTDRHYFFPSLPVVSDELTPDDVLRDMAEAVRRRRGAELQLEADDGRWCPGDDLPPPRWTERLEYLVNLEGNENPDLSEFQSSHRQRVRDGRDDSSWAFRRLAPNEGREAVYRVQKQAAERAAERGEGFEPEMPSSTSGMDASPDEPWGLAFFATFQDSELLAVALVGWGSDRGYYLRGGSTPLGYSESGQQWLQWRIMETLSEAGFSRYNLGGTPASAVDPEDPQNGLFRFKKRFGARVRATRGCWWQDMAAGHGFLHRVARRTQDRLGGRDQGRNAR